MYAQTVAYGLFAARATRSGDFDDGQDAESLIAHTNPFLRELLGQLMGQKDMDFDGLGVSELVALLRQVNMEEILMDFGRQKRGEDPVIHFYETFMKQYDPVQKTRGGKADNKRIIPKLLQMARFSHSLNLNLVFTALPLLPA
jgi:hypothetical protein